MNEDNLHSWIEPELEARIVALVVGEASDFETEELERLISEKPELILFRDRMAALHGMLGRIGAGESEVEGEWKLSAEKRQSVLNVLEGTLDEGEEDPIEEEEISEPPRRRRTSRWIVYAAAASIAIALFGLTFPASYKARSNYDDAEATKQVADVALVDNYGMKRESMDRSPVAQSSAFSSLNAPSASIPESFEDVTVAANSSLQEIGDSFVFTDQEAPKSVQLEDSRNSPYAMIGHGGASGMGESKGTVDVQNGSISLGSGGDISAESLNSTGRLTVAKTNSQSNQVALGVQPQHGGVVEIKELEREESTVAFAESAPERPAVAGKRSGAKTIQDDAIQIVAGAPIQLTPTSGEKNVELEMPSITSAPVDASGSGGGGSIRVGGAFQGDNADDGNNHSLFTRNFRGGANNLRGFDYRDVGRRDSGMDSNSEAPAGPAAPPENHTAGTTVLSSELKLATEKPAPTNDILHGGVSLQVDDEDFEIKATRKLNLQTTAEGMAFDAAPSDGLASITAPSSASADPFAAPAQVSQTAPRQLREQEQPTDRFHIGATATFGDEDFDTDSMTNDKAAMEMLQDTVPRVVGGGSESGARLLKKRQGSQKLNEAGAEDNLDRIAMKFPAHPASTHLAPAQAPSIGKVSESLVAEEIALKQVNQGLAKQKAEKLARAEVSSRGSTRGLDRGGQPYRIVGHGGYITNDELGAGLDERQREGAVAAAQVERDRLEKVASELASLRTVLSKGLIRKDFVSEIKKPYNKWGFVVGQGGENDGLVKDGVLDVYRSGEPIAKLLVTAVEPNQYSADIIPGTLAPGQQIHAGDTVISSLDIDDEDFLTGQGIEAGYASDYVFKGRRKALRGLEEKSASAEPFSTFSLHVSDVSFKLAQASLAQGEWPEAEHIRIEEFVNAFDYGDVMPTTEEKVSCNLEQAIHPFLQQRNLLRVSMRTAAEGRSASTPLRLTLLLDNSGSMERIDRQETVRRAFALLTNQLQAIDQVTLISFARQPRLLADKVTGDQARKLVETISQLPSEGGTNLEAALQLAFEKAQEQKVEGAQNRIILLTDGAANLGDAKPDSLARKIEAMRNSGIAFDAAGIGSEGLNDEILEALTRKGDGRYYLLDQPEDADAGFARQIAGALRPAAGNVKVQIEFNPDRVGHYKLLGFEKHRLKKEDFRDDKVDAAEMAAEEAGVAVYQFEPMADGSGDIGFASVRFRDMATGEMVERRWVIPYQPDSPRPDQSAPSLRVATAASLLAAKLKGGPLGEVVELEELSHIVSELPSSWQQKERIRQLRDMIAKAREIEGK